MWGSRVDDENLGNKCPCECLPLTADPYFPSAVSLLYPQLYLCDTTGVSRRDGINYPSGPYRLCAGIHGQDGGTLVQSRCDHIWNCGDDPAIHSTTQHPRGPGIATTTNYPQTAPSSRPLCLENDNRRRERRGLSQVHVRNLATIVSSAPLILHSEEAADYRWHQDVPRYRQGIG